MSPDSPETRIARLEQKVAKLEQRVEDLLISIRDQFAGLDDDIRRFGPLVGEVNHLQNQLTLALAEAKGAREDLSDLRKELKDRAEIQRVERRSDFKWFVIVTFTAVSLIVATLGLLGGVG